MKRFDPAIIIGVSIGLAAIGGAALLDGVSLKFLWQTPAALVVLGGTLGAVVVRRGVGGLRSAFRAGTGLLAKEDGDEEQAAASARLSWLARAARRDGAKTLETYAGQSNDPLVRRALTLASEYAEAGAVRAALDHMLDAEDEEGLRDAATIEAAGGFAPTFGILGAVLGLIHVLRVLDEPGALGAGIATAFVATLYGVGLANLLLFPLGARLRERHGRHMRRREALADALVALAAHESPAIIAQNFNSLAYADAAKPATASR